MTTLLLRIAAMFAAFALAGCTTHAIGRVPALYACYRTDCNEDRDGAPSATRGRRKRRLEIDPLEAERAREIYRLYLHGRDGNVSDSAQILAQPPIRIAVGYPH